MKKKANLPNQVLALDISYLSLECITHTTVLHCDFQYTDRMCLFILTLVPSLAPFPLLLALSSAHKSPATPCLFMCELEEFHQAGLQEHG